MVFVFGNLLRGLWEDFVTLGDKKSLHTMFHVVGVILVVAIVLASEVLRRR